MDGFFERKRWMKNIIFLMGLAIMVSSYGVQKDNRIVLSSESGNFFPVRVGPKSWKGYGLISKRKLSTAIVGRFTSVSEVFDIQERLDKDSIFSKWYISFSVETTSGFVHRGIECRAEASWMGSFFNLVLSNCGNSDVKLGKEDLIMVPINEIIVESDVVPVVN